MKQHLSKNESATPVFRRRITTILTCLAIAFGTISGADAAKRSGKSGSSAENEGSGSSGKSGGSDKGNSNETASNRLIITAAEPDLEESSMVISGHALGGKEFKGQVALWAPTLGFLELSVLAYDKAAQELLVSLPEGIESTPGSFLLHVVNGKQAKRSDTFSVAIGATGPQGEPGVVGPQGPQGDPGVAGPQGPQGQAGPEGPQGVPGVDGQDGAPGSIGPIGPAGPQGIQGDVGPEGKTGPQGVAGLTWQGVWNAGASYQIDDAVGHQGSAWIAIATSSGSEPGSNGEWALLASRGADGIDGAAGSQGPAGADGSDGLPGAIGPIGPVGPQGPQGPAGVDGAPGPKGDPGNDGQTGPQGIAGVTWRGEWEVATGYQIDDVVHFEGSAWIANQTNMGEQPEGGANWNLFVSKGQDGVDGSDGASGLPGIQGPQGQRGAVGPEGPQGVQGEVGPEGPPGPQGPPGPTSTTQNSLFIEADSDANEISSSVALGLDGEKEFILARTRLGDPYVKSNGSMFIGSGGHAISHTLSVNAIRGGSKIVIVKDHDLDTVFTIGSSETTVNGTLRADTLIGALSASRIAGTLQAEQIESNAIDTAKIANGTISAEDIADNAITNSKIEARAITGAKIGDRAVTEDKIGTNAVTEEKIAPNAVTSREINDGSVLASEIATNAVIESKIMNGAVTATKIGIDAIDSSKIRDGSVLPIDLDESVHRWSVASDSNDVYRDSRIALGTDTPVATLTLQQTDGNEPLMDVHYLNGGSFFKIDETGRVGLRQTFPDVRMAVRSSAGDTDAFRVVANSGRTLLNLDTSGRLGLGIIPNTTTFALRADPSHGNLAEFQSSDGTARLRLQANGVLTVNQVNELSDRRLKRDIVPLDQVLPKLMELSPRNYRMRDAGPNGAVHVGFVAQEVAEVFPELVDESGEFKSVKYTGFGVLAVKAIQEQQLELEEKDAKIEALSERLERLERLLPTENRVD